ncbi:RusA-like Holliday junction resolvase [Salmonella phage IME207]|uniref:DNA polymerase III beta subunit n=1 Tax=Salmonella phage IME207 TaxID=1873985 RepID=A0A1B1W2E3_9CAUD|nr:RusA-like Holliday junction resolvase [Salmonella phage IME207]ANW46842.1 DNA polymerase III beta subunit [Salmonella phage IME207]
MKLKINKLLLESALIFQARNDVRYYLNGICFMPDGRIASTDGHRAFIGGSHDNTLTENVIIKIGKSPTKRYDYAIIDTKSKIATYHDEAGVMVGAGICEEINGRFPDIDRVIPKETKAAEEIGFNAGYLVNIEKAAKLFNPKFCSVKFELNGNTNAAVCCLNSPSGETAKIVVMPMRIN